jgi:DNA (cytosine-5)-methyltransferase 1
MKNEKRKEIKYFSMFSGVGGFELGLRTEDNKFICVGLSEIDKFSSELLSKKFPSVKNWGDCTKINPSELPDFDLLCGGFPCQAFSIAGKREGFNDTRGTLFFEIARILEVKRPKIILLENVKGLLNHNKGETFRKIIQTLSELGYDVQWMVLNSKFFGVPQNRERVFIIGSIRGQPKPEILPFKEKCQDNNEKGGGQISSTLTSTYCKGWGGGRTAIMRGRPKMPYEQGKRELKYTTYHNTCPTLSQNCASGDQKNIVMPMIRRLTPLECERLQGFPDGWTEGFSDTQRYKMMGNAVTVNVIKSIVERLNNSQNRHFVKDL